MTDDGRPIHPQNMEALEAYWESYQRSEKIGPGEPGVERLRDALEGMVYQFAYWSDKAGGYWTGGLTPAERRVLQAMRDADSEAAAALRLGLSRHTVHAYLRNVRSKLGVRTTRQAIAKLVD